MAGRRPEAQRLLQGLEQTVKELIGDLREHVFTDQREFMDLLVVDVYFSHLGAETLMAHMIDQVLPHEEMIAARDDQFFIEHPVLFNDPKLRSDRVAHYKAVWQTNRLSPADKNALWAYFDTIIEILKAYAELKSD